MTQFLLSMLAVASFPIAVLIIARMVSRDVDRIVQQADERARHSDSAAER